MIRIEYLKNKMMKNKRATTVNIIIHGSSFSIFYQNQPLIIIEQKKVKYGFVG